MEVTGERLIEKGYKKISDEEYVRGSITIKAEWYEQWSVWINGEFDRNAMTMDDITYAVFN